jgi:hypothetical protein
MASEKRALTWRTALISPWGENYCTVTAAVAGAGSAPALFESNSMLNNTIFNALMKILFYIFMSGGVC